MGIGSPKLRPEAGGWLRGSGAILEVLRALIFNIGRRSRSV